MPNEYENVCLLTRLQILTGEDWNVIMVILINSKALAC